MSRIDDVIAELCPRGVAFKTLGEVGSFTRGNGLQKKDLVDDGVGAIHYGQIFTIYGTYTRQTRSFASPVLARSLRKADPGDLIVATTSENDEDVCKAVAWLGDAGIVISGDAYVYAHSLDPLYVTYLFQTDAFQAQKRRYITGTKVKRISGSDLAKITIPVPPPEVQREIVSILTAMESLEAALERELEAEVQARRRQYEYYRDALLTFSEGDRVRWVSLGDIATIGTGGRNTVDARSSGTYPFFVRSQQVRYMDDYDFDEIAVITSGDGVGVGKVFHYVNGKYALHQRAYRIHVTSPELNPKFFFYFMRNDFLRYMETAAVRSSVTSVRKPMLDSYPVPVPPLKLQQRIVEVFDNFDSLVTDLSIWLPAEVNARRRQYEYYRNRLLTFEEAPT